jgi:ribonuclease HI
MSTLYNIWADGSYRQKNGLLGAGWITRQSKNVIEEKSLILPRLTTDHNLGSSIAEIQAFTHSMMNIPSQAIVHMHMDCANVVTWLNKGGIISTKAKNSSLLQKSFTEAMAQISRMHEIDISFVTGKNNPNLSLAHTLSRQATSGLSQRR